ncbi:hypothetical protein H2199_001871 [Coniosporium tulheliwenetii]|uniref:Uncharacterized protein n=1 Tax=Coniosporium tulheliwenetii TaxID=3383036 RepID=A0ACC2ZKK5_9PEZI|nr:hypothetical protein H2199_001871 [Cladosporium sp. JES 115]
MSSETEPEKTRNTIKPEDDERPEPIRFSPKRKPHYGAYSEAIQGYEGALSTCPNYLEYEIAVLRSNIAACHLKLADWKAAMTAATEALEALDRLDPPAKKLEGKVDEGVVEEVDEETAEKIEALARSGRTRDDVQKIRTKALLRRAKARMETGGWAALQGADEDYKQLAAMPNLSPLDRKSVDSALRTLPPRLAEAKQKEMGEMMDKLKQLGNGILKPFGLSTDNFNMIKDEKTGGYSMQFNQNK